MCDRDIHWLSLARLQLGTRPATQARALTENQTSNLRRPALSPLSHTCQVCSSCLIYSAKKWNHTVFVWLSSLSIMPPGPSHVVANGKSSFFFYGWAIFHCINIPLLFYPFINWWTFLVASTSWLYCKYSAMNTWVHVSFWISASGFFRKYPGAVSV